MKRKTESPLDTSDNCTTQPPTNEQLGTAFGVFVAQSEFYRSVLSPQIDGADDANDDDYGIAEIFFGSVNGAEPFSFEFEVNIAEFYKNPEVIKIKLATKLDKQDTEFLKTIEKNFTQVEHDETKFIAYVNIVDCVKNGCIVSINGDFGNDLFKIENRHDNVDFIERYNFWTKEDTCIAEDDKPEFLDFRRKLVKDIARHTHNIIVGGKPWSIKDQRDLCFRMQRYRHEIPLPGDPDSEDDDENAFNDNPRGDADYEEESEMIENLVRDLEKNRDVFSTKKHARAKHVEKLKYCCFEVKKGVFMF